MTRARSRRASGPTRGRAAHAAAAQHRRHELPAQGLAGAPRAGRARAHELRRHRQRRSVRPAACARSAAAVGANPVAWLIPVSSRAAQGRRVGWLSLGRGSQTRHAGVGSIGAHSASRVVQAEAQSDRNSIAQRSVTALRTVRITQAAVRGLRFLFVVHAVRYSAGTLRCCVSHGRLPQHHHDRQCGDRPARRRLGRLRHPAIRPNGPAECRRARSRCSRAAQPPVPVRRRQPWPRSRLGSRQRARRHGNGGSVAVVTAAVHAERLATQLNALGTAQANEAVEITSKSSNIVTAVRFRDGERVQKGQVLVELDSAQARADLAAAEAARAESASQVKRSRELLSTQSRLRVPVRAARSHDEGQRGARRCRALACGRHGDSCAVRGRVGLRRVSVGSSGESRHDDHHAR